MPKAAPLTILRCPRGHPPDWHLAAWKQHIRAELDRDPSGWPPALALVATLAQARILPEMAELGAVAQVNILPPESRVCLGLLAVSATTFTHMDAADLVLAGIYQGAAQSTVIILTWRKDLATIGPRDDTLGNMLANATEDDLMHLARMAATSWRDLGGDSVALRSLASRAVWKQGEPAST